MSASELNASTIDLEMGSVRSDMVSWTELKAVRVDREVTSRNNSLQRKRNHHLAASSNGSLRRTYVTCSNDDLDKEDFDDERDTKIFPKEHYKGSRKHSLNRKRTSMGDG